MEEALYLSFDRLLMMMMKAFQIILALESKDTSLP